MGHPKENRENERLVAAKNRGQGGKPKENRENKWIGSGKKQGQGWANLRKKRK